MAELTKQQRVKIEEILKRKFSRVYDTLENRVRNKVDEYIKEMNERDGIATEVETIKTMLNTAKDFAVGIEKSLDKIDNAMPNLVLKQVVWYDIANVENALDRLTRSIKERFREQAMLELRYIHGLDRVKRFEEDAIDSLWLASAGADVQNLIDQVDRQLQMFLEEAIEEVNE